MNAYDNKSHRKTKHHLTQRHHNLLIVLLFSPDSNSRRLPGTQFPTTSCTIKMAPNKKITLSFLFNRPDNTWPTGGCPRMTLLDETGIESDCRLGAGQSLEWSGALIRRKNPARSRFSESACPACSTSHGVWSDKITRILYWKFDETGQIRL